MPANNTQNEWMKKQMVTAFEAWKLYHACRLHFNPKTDYDAVEYNFGTNASMNSMGNRVRWCMGMHSAMTGMSTKMRRVFMMTAFTMSLEDRVAAPGVKKQIIQRINEMIQIARRVTTTSAVFDEDDWLNGKVSDFEVACILLSPEAFDRVYQGANPYIHISLKERIMPLRGLAKLLTEGS